MCTPLHRYPVHDPYQPEDKLQVLECIQNHMDDTIARIRECYLKFIQGDYTQLLHASLYYDGFLTLVSQLRAGVRNYDAGYNTVYDWGTRVHLRDFDHMKPLEEQAELLDQEVSVMLTVMRTVSMCPAGPRRLKYEDSL